MMRSLIRLIQKTYGMIEHPDSRQGLHNVISLSSLQLITYILPLVIIPYLFRTIGPEKFGLIAFAQAFVQYFSIFIDYGFNVTATKEIALYKEDHYLVVKVFSGVMAIKLVFAFLSLCVMGLIVFLLPKFKQDWAVYWLSFGAVWGGAFFPTWFFQGIERMKYIAQLNIFGQCIYTLCIFLFIHTPHDYLLVPLLTSLVALLTGVWGQYAIIHDFKIHFQWPLWQEVKLQLEAGWNVFISNVAINAYTITRVFAVGLFTNNTITGFYSIAERIANAVQTFPLSSFSQAIFPRLAHIFHRNKAKAFEIMQQVQLITITISLISLPIVFILSPQIIDLACGARYPVAILALRFLLVAVFFVSANAFRVQFLLVCGMTKTYSKIHITMAAIGLPLIIVSIHAFSYVGAAMATAIIEGGVFTLTFLTIKNLSFLHESTPMPIKETS